MFRAFLNFDTFIFPRIASIVYWIGLVLIVFGTVVSSFGMLFMGSTYGGQMGMGGGFGGFLAALVSGVIGIIVWRVLVEFWLVVFSIRDTLGEIRDQGKGMS